MLLYKDGRLHLVLELARPGTLQEKHTVPSTESKKKPKRTTTNKVDTWDYGSISIAAMLAQSFF
jgi:hypothetical protein